MKKISIKREQSQAGLSFAEREIFRPQVKNKLLLLLALLMMVVTGAWADDTYTVQFKANGNTKTVENVVLPHQFRCDFSSENGELDQIIKELYGLSGGYCNGDLRSSGNENVTCGSSDMDDYITISAPFEGTATVTGWYYSSTLIHYSLEISIPGYVAPTVNVTGVSLSETTASMTVGGDALTLTATVAPDDATDKTVTWTTSDAAVATVADGVVTAVAAGTATITATATNGTADTSDDKTATCTVTVAEPTYTVTVKEGTEDGDNWTISPTEAAEGSPVTATYSGEKKVKSVKAVKKEATPAIDYSTAKLGDLFYSDGTFSTELEAGKTPIGVIAYLDKEGTDDDEICEKSNGAGHGLVLCLKNAASGAAWSTDEVSKFKGQEVNDAAGLKRTTNVSGYTNTAALTVDEATAAKYPAAKAAKEYTTLTAPKNTTGWFLPSAQQWVKMQTGLGALQESSITWNSWFDNNHEGADRWEAALSKAGSGNYDSMTSDYLLYWSSSEYSDLAAVRLSVDATDLGADYGFTWNYSYKGYKENDHRTRPVLAF